MNELNKKISELCSNINININNNSIDHINEFNNIRNIVINNISYKKIILKKFMYMMRKFILRYNRLVLNSNIKENNEYKLSEHVKFYSNIIEFILNDNIINLLSTKITLYHLYNIAKKKILIICIIYKIFLKKYQFARNYIDYNNNIKHILLINEYLNNKNINIDKNDVIDEQILHILNVLKNFSKKNINFPEYKLITIRKCIFELDIYIKLIFIIYSRNNIKFIKDIYNINEEKTNNKLNDYIIKNWSKFDSFIIKREKVTFIPEILNIIANYMRNPFKLRLVCKEYKEFMNNKDFCKLQSKIFHIKRKDCFYGLYKDFNYNSIIKLEIPCNMFCITYFKNLKELYYYDNIKYINTKYIPISIEKLKICNNHFIDNDKNSLLHLINLKYLDITHCRNINENGIPKYKLHTLLCANTNVKYLNTSEFKNLRTLNIRNCKKIYPKLPNNLIGLYCNIKITDISNLTKLKYLYCNNSTNLNPNTISNSITYLNCSSCDNFKNLSHLINLKKLICYSCPNLLGKYLPKKIKKLYTHNQININDESISHLLNLKVKRIL